MDKSQPLSKTLTKEDKVKKAVSTVTKTLEYKNETINCAHRVKYRFWGNTIPEDLHSALDEEAERRSQEMITDNYQAGELLYEDDDIELQGWWQIDRS